MMIDLSVVIATYNRADLLQQALRALEAQQVPDSLRWEIVVVDNNSRDATPQVVHTFSETSPVCVHYVFEPRQGQSHARNRGIQESRGAVIAFTDDDVLPAPDWVAGIHAAFDRWKTDGVGGRILPQWDASPPLWLSQSRDLLARLALMDSEESRLLTFPTQGWPQVWGANMAFRRDLFEKVGTFDPDRGMMGTKLFRGEEVDLINRALQSGLTVAYDASLTVFHRIGPDRIRRAYFYKLMYDIAQGEVRSEPPVTGRTFLGAPLWLYRVAFTDFWKCAASLLLRRPQAFARRLDWVSILGRLSAYWKTPRASR